MEPKLRSRKPDLLDELNAYRYQRRLAYEENRKTDVLKYNLEIKEFRLCNGWLEGDANEEFVMNQNHFSAPFAAKNSLLRFDVLNTDGKPANAFMSINQLSKYNFMRGLGFTYAESLEKCR